MKTVLLTGATGFLGSHLIEALVKAGYQLVVLKRSTSDTLRIQHLIEQVVSYDVDLESMHTAFSEQEIDIVVHTACHYGRNGDSISRITESNLLFGIELLDAAILHKVPTFINTDTLLPKNTNAYSLSKKQFVEWLRFVSDQIQVINFRPEHMYGPKDDTAKFVPWLISQLENSQDSVRLTPGQQKRDFVYIDDVVAAYLIVLSKTEELSAFEEFDIGSGLLTTVREFVEMLYSTYEKKIGKISAALDFGALPYRSGELMRAEVDLKGLKNLGWSPRVSLNMGLDSVVRGIK